MSDVADYFAGNTGDAKTANMAAQEDNPDDAARAVELGNASGVPATAIYGDVEGFEAQHKAALGSAIIDNNHFISDYLSSHPMAPRLSHDDLGALDKATDSITQVSGVAASSTYKRYAGRYAAFGEGFKEGFGTDPVGSWMGDYPRDHPVSAAGWQALTGVPEIGLRAISGVVHGLAEEVRSNIAKGGNAIGINGDLLGRDLAGMLETEAMGMSGRHGMPSPEMHAVVAGAVRSGEAFLRQGEMPPTGVHPFWDSMYKADADAKATQLDRAVSDSAATATRERSPEFFKNFAEGPAGDATIRVDANAVAQLYGDKAPEVDDGILGWVPDLQERLDETAGSGGYIDVPLKDWLAHIDPDVHKELRDDILIGDSGFTVNEAKDVPDWQAPKAEAVPEDEEAPKPIDPSGTLDTPTQAVRGAAGMEPMLAVGDRKLTLMKREQRDATYKPDAENKPDEYHLLDETGKKVGWLDVLPSKDGTQLYVENVGGFESKGYNPNSFGPALVRSLLRQLKETYPNMKEIGGFRISGAREKAGAEGAATVKLDWGDPQHVRDFTQMLRDNWEHVTDDGQVEALFHTDEKGLAANSPLGQMVMQTLNKLVPEANPDVAHGLVMDKDPVWGAYIPEFKQIIVSLESKHPLGTAAHEAIHALRDMRLFTQDEWRTLESASYEHNWEKKYNVAQRWGDLPRSASIEESIAEAYRDWRDGKAAATPEVHTIFERMKTFFADLLKRVADHLGLRADNWDDIFHRVDTGEVGGRDSFEQSGGLEPQAQRPEDGPPPLNIKPPFAKGKAIGIRQDIYKRYMKLIEQRHEADLRADFATAHDDERRRQTKEWKENAASVREQVTAELDAKPNILVDRLMSERGGELKIDPMSVSENLRESLPREYFRRTNSLSADDLAGHFGYPSGDALVEHLAEVAQDRKASGLSHGDYTKKLIEDETQRRMESQYGWLAKNVLEDAKDRAFSQNQIDILHEETLMLAERAGMQLPLERSAIDRELTNAFMSTPTGSIKSSLWIKSAGKAGRENEEALLKDDYMEALKAKQRQYNAVFQGKLAIAYEKAAKALDRTAKRVGKLEPARGKPTPIEPEYLNHVQDLLRRVGYNTRRSLENIRENISRQSAKTVQAFVESKLAESGGYRDIPLAEFLWDPGFATPKEKLNAGQFYDFKNTIDGLVREGRDEQSILIAGEKFDKDQIIGEMRGQLQSFPERDVPHGYEPGLGKHYIAGSTSIETLMNRWDRNDPRGIFNKFVSYPLASASNAASRLEREMAQPYRALPDAGDLKKLMASPLDPEVWKYSTFTRENLLGLIQNAGNKSNWETTARGWGAKPDELWDWLVQNSTPEDWQRAQQLGKTIFADLIKRADAQYEHRYGSTIDKIPLTPFELEFPKIGENDARTVKLDGWYHPLTPDPTWRGKQRVRGGAYEDADYNHIATSNGYVRSRTGATYPVDLSFSKIPQLIKQQIHDISFRDAVLEVQKIFRDGAFQNDVTKYYGKEYTDMLLPYLKNVAGQEAVPSKLMQRLGAASEYLRQNTIGTYIGFNPFTVAKHAPTAAFMSMGDVGPARMLWAYKNLWREQSPGGKSWWDFALEHSEELQRRERNWQESFGAVQKETYGDSTMRERMLQWGSWPVALSDKFSAVPLWVARFDKSISEGSSFGEARDLADRSVRRQHGSTSVTNQPLLVQGGGPLHGWLTSVYGFFGTVMQRRIELAHQANDIYKLGREGEISKAASNAPKLFKDFLTYVVVPTAIEEYVTGLTTDDREGFGTHMAKAAVKGTASSFLYLRDLAYAFTTGHDPSVGLLSSPLHDAQKSINDITKGRAALNRTHAGKTVQDFVTTFGEATGLAPKVFANIARFGIDYANRQQRPKAVGDWFRGLTRGEIKKREEK